MAKRKIGILTSGGDCPGLNATIWGAVRSCVTALGADNVEFVGISGGYHGLINDNCKVMNADDFSGIFTLGGTMLTSIRTPYKKMREVESDGVDKIAAMKSTYNKYGLDCVLTLGGRGSHRNAHLLSQEGMNVIGLPKTIDNDIFGTDVTFGFHTAVEIGADALDRIHTTAKSHNRAIVVEIMGNRVGWLALYTGIAGAADMILIPEIPYKESRIVESIQSRVDAGESGFVVVVAEGAMSEGEASMKKKERKRLREESGEKTVTNSIARLIESKTGVETRVFVPGHMLRGGSPSACDRVLSARFGAKAAELIVTEDYGRMVACVNGEITSANLDDIAGQTKFVDVSSNVVKTARDVGIDFCNENKV